MMTVRDLKKALDEFDDDQVVVLDVPDITDLEGDTRFRSPALIVRRSHDIVRRSLDKCLIVGR